jgi:hypothetical protein
MKYIYEFHVPVSVLNLLPNQTDSASRMDQRYLLQGVRTAASQQGRTPWVEVEREGSIDTAAACTLLPLLDNAWSN